VPKDTEFTLEFASRYVKVYIFVNGRGLVGLLRDLGQAFHQPMFPKRAVPWDELSSNRQDLQSGHNSCKLEIIRFIDCTCVA
jgi:hypothetical protein